MEIMPQIKIVDIQKMRERTGAFLRGVWNAGRVTELCLSEHRRGAAEMLDRAMDDQPQLPFDSYDDMGCYIDRADC